jgi:hypothetical protein
VISEKLLGTFRDERGNNKFTYHPEFRLPYSNSTIGFDEEEIINLPAAMRKVFLISEATGYPPVYYWYIALINKLVWGQDLITRVFLSRVATVLISTAGILAAYGVARQVFVSRITALATAAIWGFMPMRQFVGSGVTGDALMNAVYPLALWCLIKLAAKPSRKIFWLSILIVGVSLAVKLQSVFIVAVLAAALIIAGRKQNGLGRQERRFGKLAMGMIGLAFLVMVMGHVRPLASRFPRLLGYLFLPEIANFSNLYSKPTVVEYVKVSTVELYRQVFPWYFGVYRWLSLTLPIWVYRIIKVILLISAAGWMVGLLKKKQKIVRLRRVGLVLLSVVIYAGGILGWNFFYWKSHGFSLGIQGRYFFPNLTEHMAVLLMGLILFGRSVVSVIPAEAGIYLNRFLLKSGMTIEKIVGFVALMLMIAFNWFSLWFVSQSYYGSLFSYQTFFLRASQYKPWFFKTPLLEIWVGLGILTSVWFLLSLIRYTRDIRALEH